MSRSAVSLLIVLLALSAQGLGAETPVPASSDAGKPSFRQATAAVQAGDLPAALTAYRALAAAGNENTALFWNWAQVATARGSLGEAIWALLRARELDPGDPTIERELDQVRRLVGLDPAELSPEPLAALDRLGRRFSLGLVAVVGLLASLALHGAARVVRTARWPVATAWACLAVGLLATAVVLVGGLAPPTAVVVRRGAVLLDAPAAGAASLATLREGEVVPILEESGAFLLVQDSSGARGWAASGEVFRLDRSPVT